MLDCQIHTQPDAIDSLTDEWEQVSESDPQATLFQQWRWNHIWWQRYGGSRPLIAVFRDGAAVVGLAPLFVSRSATGHEVVRFIGTGPSDYGDILAHPDYREAVAGDLAHLLLKELGLVLDLQQIRGDSAILLPLERALDRAGGSPRKLLQEQAFSLDLPADWDAMLARLGSKTRYNIKYYRRRLYRDHQVELIETPVAEEIDQAMGVFFDLHQRRWRKRFLPGLFLFSSSRRYHLDVARSFLDAGQLLLYRIRLDGREAAAFYGFRYREADYFYLAGFHPDFAHLSVGTVLIGEMISRAIGAGSRRFEFLRGEEAYKSRWKASGKVNYRLLAAPASVRSSFYLALMAKENKMVLKAKNRLRGGFRLRTGAQG